MTTAAAAATTVTHITAGVRPDKRSQQEGTLMTTPNGRTGMQPVTVRQATIDLLRTHRSDDVVR